MCPLRPTTEAPQRFQYGEIRFARAILVDTLPVPDPHCPLRGYLGHEGLHQGGFAHPGFARDEHHLPRALPGRGVAAVQGRQLRLATHQKPRHRARRGQRRCWRWNRDWGQRGVGHRYIGHKPQPVAVYGLNHPLRAPTVAHRAAHHLDAGGQGLLPHVLVGPHLCQHFVAGDHPVALLDEIHQHLKDLAPQRDAHTTPAQFVALRVKRTVAKDIVHCRWSSLTSEASYTPAQSTGRAVICSRWPHCSPTAD